MSMRERILSLHISHRRRRKKPAGTTTDNGPSQAHAPPAMRPGETQPPTRQREDTPHRQQPLGSSPGPVPQNRQHREGPPPQGERRAGWAGKAAEPGNTGRAAPGSSPPKTPEQSL